MGRYRKLMSNSIVFTIGNFGSKLISFLMVPLYTYLLSTEEYGTVDLIVTTITLLVPLLTLELGQAALRYTIEYKEEKTKKEILFNINLYLLVISLIIVLLSPVISRAFSSVAITGLFVLLLINHLFNNVYSQYLRGIGKTKEFAINGILTTLLTVVSNLLLLVKFKLGISGYLLSLVISMLGSNIYLLVKIREYLACDRKYINKQLMKLMLKYSVPMVPNSIMWWLISGLTKYFIVYYIGAAANGLYAIANKIPTIVSTITNIFTQAWQLSSFEEYESKDRDEFYSRVFNLYWVFMFTVASAILVVLKPVMSFLVEDSYYESWVVIPNLLLSVLYQSFAGFLGTSYNAAKETKGTFTTSVYAGVISVVANFLLIPKFGIMGASIGSVLSFLGMFIARYFDTKKYVTLTVDWGCFLSTNIVYIAQLLVLFVFDGWQLIAIQAVYFVVLLIVNRKLLLDVWQMLKKRR